MFITREPDFDAIDVYRFSDRRVARLARLGFRVSGSDTNMSVSRDGRWALATKMERFDSDLMLLDNFRVRPRDIKPRVRRYVRRERSEAPPHERSEHGAEPYPTAAPSRARITRPWPPSIPVGRNHTSRFTLRPSGSLRRTTMKIKTMALLVVACLAGVTIFAADQQIGTWKLNEAKSKLNPAGTKNTAVGSQAVGDNVKVTVEGTTPDGKAFKSTWTGKYDGKDYPVPAIPCLTRARPRKSTIAR